MSALPRPDIPPGPLRDLNRALHDLHHRAGWPSLRALAGQAGYSHTTVSKAFSSGALPAWGNLELLVEAMDGDTGHFRELWLAASAPDDPAPTLPIAGRRNELAACRRQLESGTGLLLVGGEAGIGKTRLVGTAAASTDAFVAVGRCLPLSTEIPMLPVADCLRSTLDADAAWLSRAVDACAPYVASSVASLVPELATSTPTPTDDRQLLFAAVAAVLKSLATERPMALLLEDLHWADPATLDLLEHLLGRACPVPMLGTWRSVDDATPASSNAWLERVRRSEQVAELALGPLSREESVEQLELLGAAGPSERWAGILARSRGQPLFTEQLAAHLDEGEPLPALLIDLLDRRLGGLDDTAWSVVRVLGLADRPLPAAGLAVAAGLTSEALTSQLRRLQGRRLLRTVDGDAVQLQHPLLAEATRRRLVPGEAAAVHRAIAEALESDSTAEAAELAVHWRGAGDQSRELACRVDAARAALARFDRVQEGDHWLRVLEIWPTDDEGSPPPISHAAAYVATIDALKNSFRLPRAKELSAEADEVLHDVEDVMRAELLYRSAEFRSEDEDVTVALAALDEALAIFDRLPTGPGKVLALEEKWLTLVNVGRFDDALPVLTAALGAARELDDPALERRCLLRTGWQQGATGDLAGALAAIEEASALVQPGTDPLGDLQRAVLTTDVMLFGAASAEWIRTVGDVGLAVAREHGIDNYQVLLIRFNVFCALLHAGRVAQAAEVLPGGADEAFDLERWPAQLARALVDAAAGRLDDAAERTEQIWSGIGTHSETDVELVVLSGGVDCWSGKPARALGRALTALHIVAGSAPIPVAGPALVLAARCAADLSARDPGSREELLATLRRLDGRAGLTTLRRPVAAYPTALAAAFAAETARLAGGDRIGSWTRAASVWDRIERPHDAAYCRWRAAQCALREGQGTVAARLLKRAATDAREHVPLLEAIRRTAQGR